MRKLISIIVIATLAPGPQALLAKAVYDGIGRIEITGKNNTLASVAADVGDTNVFAYVPATRTATCRALSVSVAAGGELAVGVKDQKDKGENLIFECEVTPGLTEKTEGQDKGKYSFSAEQGGSLCIYHSKIEAVNGLIRPGTARHRGVDYNSLSSGEVIDATICRTRGLTIGRSSRVNIDGLISRNCVYGVYCHGKASSSIRGVKTENCLIGAYVRPDAWKGSAPKLVDCILNGSRAAIFYCRIGKNTNPLLTHFVDCRLPAAPDKRISFVGNNSDDLGIVVSHTVKLCLIDQNKAPMAGVQLSLSAMAEGMPAFDPQVVLTDKTGSAWLTVPEYVDYHFTADEPAVGKHILCAGRLTTSAGQVLKENWRARRKHAVVLAQTASGFTETEAQYTEGKSVTIHNLVMNSSFETASYPGVPDCWWPRSWFEVKKNGMGRTKTGGPLSFLGLDSKNPYHGKHCFRIGYGTGHIYRKPFYLPGGKAYTFSAYMRSDVPGTKGVITYRLTGMKPWSFELTSKWERYDFTAFVKNNFVLLLSNGGPGDVYMDAIQIEEGAELHPYVTDNYKPFVY